MSILEKIDEPEARATLIEMRNRLIDRLRPRRIQSGALFTAAIACFLSAFFAIGFGVAFRTILYDPSVAPSSGPLIWFGIGLLFSGLVVFVAAILVARRRSYEMLPKVPRAPQATSQRRGR